MGFLYFDLILFTIIFICLAHACQKSCNGNGFCYIENETEKCKCLDRIYVGESCEQMVNYCADSPCKNDGECRSSPGQYNCLCTGEFRGQNCTIKKKLFGQVYLLYNHLAPISENNSYLIILTDLGTVESMAEMITPGYAIVGGLNFPSDNSKNFLQTNNIQEIAKKYNVPTTSLPTGRVFYHAGKYRMATDGIATVLLTITDFSDFSLYYTWNFQFGSVKNVGCNPSIEIASCGTPKNPVKVNANQAIFVEANVRRDCGHDSIISYDWSISDYFDTRTLQTFDGSGRSLKISPFGLQINLTSENGFVLMKLLSLERSMDGGRSGESIKRCYITIVRDKPIAKISGGDSQEYSYNQTIVMDGSDSVDLSLHPKTNQNLLYLWQCTSNDDGEYCKKLNGKTGKVSAIP